MAADSFSKQYIASGSDAFRVREALKTSGNSLKKTGNLISLKELAKRISLANQQIAQK